MVYRITLSYRGSGYAGWQRQSNATAVQEVVERALTEVLTNEVTLVGASRTDAGVHARGQVAHFHSERAFPCRGLVHATNGFLPEDVRVMAADRMPEDFHARKHAVSKEYRYRLVRGAIVSPLEGLFAIRARPDLDVGAMRLASETLVGRHDFTAFALAGGSHRSPLRTIMVAEWIESREAATMRLIGDGFLRGMVRSLVGTLIEVGSGQRSVEGFSELLQGRSRGEAGPTAPARGLELHHVTYPEAWGPLPD